jgi:hypothetical protein
MRVFIPLPSFLEMPHNAGVGRMLKVACLLLANVTLASAVLHIHNPSNASVKEVHVVFSWHFDGGCKTPGCGALLNGEPDLCAKVGAGNAHGATDPFGTGEPFNYHIINRYFDSYIPGAIGLAKQLEGSDTPYTFMLQSWVASLYLDCANAGFTLWPGAITNGLPLNTSLLHCPNSSSVDTFKSALQKGLVFMHSFPHNGEASYYPDASLFESALNIAEHISSAVGIPAPIAVSQRDVPGWTRAAIPLLHKHGIRGLSFGAGTPPGKPDTPPLFVWRDEGTSTEVVATYETAYGNDKTAFVLPNGIALVVQWDGDNTGPPDGGGDAGVKNVKNVYTYLQTKFPGADVHASTFDAFFKEAWVESVKKQLPVVTQEIGDGWIYGVPSDPLKNAMFREVSRQRLACVESGECDPMSPEMRAFDRLLVKVPGE